MMMPSTLLALGLFIVSTSAAAAPAGTPTLSSVLSGILATLEESKTPVTLQKLLDGLNKAGDDITALLGGKTVDHDEVSKMMEGCSKEDGAKATLSMEGFFSFENKDLATALGQLKCLALQAGGPNADKEVALAAIGETTANVEAILDSLTAEMVSGGNGDEGNDRVRRHWHHHHWHHHHWHHVWHHVWHHIVKPYIVRHIIQHVVVAYAG